MASKIKYVSANKPGNAPSYSAPKAYSSDYTSQINNALGDVTNFSYDPMQDASYKALAKVYTAKGDQAAKTTMGDAAALNGGYGSSYATSAAQQARNDYNMQLASYIPELEQNAYDRNVQKLSALRDADESAYGRYRDNVSDKQWQYSQNYQKWADKNQNYWNAKDYNLNVYQAKKAKSSGSGSSGRGGSKRAGYSSGYSYLGNDDQIFYKMSGDAQKDAEKQNKKANGNSGKSSGGSKPKQSNPYMKYSPAWYGWNNKKK